MGASTSRPTVPATSIAPQSAPAPSTWSEKVACAIEAGRVVPPPSYVAYPSHLESPTSPSSSSPSSSSQPRFTPTHSTSDRRLRIEAEAHARLKRSLSVSPSTPPPVLSDSSIDAMRTRALLSDSIRLCSLTLSNLDVGEALSKRLCSADVALRNKPFTHQVHPSSDLLSALLGSAPSAGQMDISRSYLLFHHRLEQAAMFLEASLGSVGDGVAEEAEWERLAREPISKGASWHDVCYVVGKYGLVPTSVFPEARNLLHSTTLDKILTTALQGHAIAIRAHQRNILRDLERSGAGANAPHPRSSRKEMARNACQDIKAQALEEIFTILCASSTVPPSPTSRFLTSIPTSEREMEMDAFGFAARLLGSGVSKGGKGVEDALRSEFVELRCYDQGLEVVGEESTSSIIQATFPSFSNSILRSLEAGHAVWCDVIGDWPASQQASEDASPPLPPMSDRTLGVKEAFGIESFGLCKSSRICMGADGSERRTYVLTAARFVSPPSSSTSSSSTSSGKKDKARMHRGRLESVRMERVHPPPPPHAPHQQQSTSVSASSATWTSEQLWESCIGAVMRRADLDSTLQSAGMERKCKSKSESKSEDRRLTLITSRDDSARGSKGWWR